MTYTNKTNGFFKNKIYNNLEDFAFSPVSWMAECKRKNKNINLKNESLFYNAVYMPIMSLVSMSLIAISVIATILISLALAVVSALAHGLSLLVSGALDALPSSPVPAL